MPPPAQPDPNAAAYLGKQQQILAGAETLFLAHGYEGTSMSQVARQAGVSKGTLYNYFDSKAALFSALVENLSVAKQPFIVSILDNDSEDCTTTLIKLAEKFIRVMMTPTALMLYRIIVAEAAKFPQLADIFWQQAFGRTLGVLVPWIEKRTARGELNVQDATLAAEQFMSLAQTHLVNRRRFELPVTCDEAQIARISIAAGTAFCKIYAPD